MKQRVKQRLPFALLAGLIIIVGYQIIDLGSAWQVALVAVAAVTAGSGAVMMDWRRDRRSLREDNSRPHTPV
jgi:hypothetical protein